MLPAPHQILVELKKTVIDTPMTSRRILVFHAWVTLSSTLVGFAIGALPRGSSSRSLIVHVKTLERSLMPWIISSQTIPILAIAPIIIVVLGSIGITGLLPKAIISAYLCFFPVTISMVKGLTSPDPMQRDLMRTYSASLAQTLWKLRLPGLAAVSLRGPEGRDRHQPRRRHRRRTADRRAGGPRGPAAGRVLLRPDHPDLGGPVRGGVPRLRSRRSRRHRREAG